MSPSPRATRPRPRPSSASRSTPGASTTWSPRWTPPPGGHRRAGGRVRGHLRRRARAPRGRSAISRCATVPRSSSGSGRSSTAGGFAAFTTNFEDLGGLKQLPGLAVQRLMADGYGFGAEGDWKTAVLVRAAKVMGAGLPGGASLMEDYTYDLTPGRERILGAHMLEVCPSLTVGQAAAGDPPAVHRRPRRPGPPRLHRRPRPGRRRRPVRHARPLPPRRQRRRGRPARRPPPPPSGRPRRLEAGARLHDVRDLLAPPAQPITRHVHRHRHRGIRGLRPDGRHGAPGHRRATTAREFETGSARTPPTTGSPAGSDARPAPARRAPGTYLVPGAHRLRGPGRGTRRGLRGFSARRARSQGRTAPGGTNSRMERRMRPASPKACRKLARVLWWKPTRPPILDPSPEARLPIRRCRSRG